MSDLPRDLPGEREPPPPDPRLESDDEDQPAIPLPPPDNGQIQGDDLSLSAEGLRRRIWRFCTPRYEAVCWEIAFMRVAEIWARPRGHWPIAAAVDLHKRKSRQALVREACSRSTDKIVRGHLHALMHG